MNLSGMLLSMRMARRDALRAKGRSALVITLIALPIASVTAFTVLDSAFDSGQNTTRSLGAAEAELAWDYTSPLLQDPTARHWVEPVDDSLVKREEPAGTADVLALLPKGSTAIDTTTESSTSSRPTVSLTSTPRASISPSLWPPTGTRSSTAPCPNPARSRSPRRPPHTSRSTSARSSIWWIRGCR